MRTADLAAAAWRRSSHSVGNGDNANCVEVAEVVAMRDSKDPAGPVLAFPRPDWRTFLVGVRSGQFS